jgi:hypothetical protein
MSSMPNNGLDEDAEITEELAQGMVAAGKKTAIRYDKNITAAETFICKKYDIYLVTVVEYQGNDYDSYTFEQGVTDATRAIFNVKAVGMPPGLGLYYCGDDFDATQQQIDGGITNYMQGANSVASKSNGYDGVGVYGNGACCKTFLGNKLATKAFLWGAEDTNGTVDFDASGAWTIKQYPTINEFGSSVDPDEVKGTPEEYWGWITTLTSPDVTVYSNVQIQEALINNGYSLEPYGADGNIGSVTIGAIQDFQSKNNLPVTGIVDTATATALGL